MSSEKLEICPIPSPNTFLRLVARAPRPIPTQHNRDTAESLLVLQLASLDAEAKDISARHGLAPPELSQPQPGDSDDEGGGDADDAGSGEEGAGGGGDVAPDLAGDAEEAAEEVRWERG